ncbi:TPT-domain-containing protein [Eremomyces bilateralis CBS 781.70]|uniref:TPT-domain-containing protein n=1 Tax=Eremomyces bilateralis CBS 781.70 TaxID=1392243 RepID=A0A6G1FWC5_9PEZI|nr:TPT-domain-containing protein [Eremomyces bilateralis CBS 781.70]KAF1810084.1 TPT-domain-containing protein [Eremomyces bilateralis CBS 781.70]
MTAVPSSPGPSTLSKFPAFDPPEQDSLYSGRKSQSPARTGSFGNGHAGGDRWQARRSSGPRWPASNGAPMPGPRHSRQKSLSEAIRTIRTRRASVSANAHEIADALKAPISPKLVVLCGIWYAASVISNTSSKAILTTFPKPMTLTIIQFGIVPTWCVVLGWVAIRFPAVARVVPVLKNGVQPPNRDLIRATLPLTVFQIGGHILTSDATTRLPVSLVHTIKGLSPLFTVIASRSLLNVKYSTPTYLSLIPLTIGVILACSANFSSNLLGLVSAVSSTLLFVTQNIFSKRLFTEAALSESTPDSRPSSKKPDRLNLLAYSMGIAFFFTFPLWLWSDGITILRDLLTTSSIRLSDRPGALDHGALTLEYIFNGTFHFIQSIVAFILLSLVSPVTYSVASLMKRVCVVTFAILWFRNSFSNTQGFGIFLTFLGLYLYDRTSDAARADRRAKMFQPQAEPLLPLVENPGESGSPPAANGHRWEGKRDDDRMQHGRTRGETAPQWLPPGTKAEQTWIPGQDIRGNQVTVI